MEIKFIGTGSVGNCIAVVTESTTILIDIGIAKTKVEKSLIEQGINPTDIDAIFLTHEHSDHIKGLPLAEKWNIPVYATEGTWKSLNPQEKDGRITVGNYCYYSDGLDVGAFRTYHDAYDSCGFIISVDDGTKISVCLDTGKIDDEMIQAMSDSDIYIIEANHNTEMLIANEDRPDSVKSRILSDIGHLSNEQTAEALCKLIHGKGEQIYLAHLSGANNRPEIAMATVMRALKGKGLKMNKDYTMRCV